MMLYRAALSPYALLPPRPAAPAGSPVRAGGENGGVGCGRGCALPSLVGGRGGVFLSLPCFEERQAAVRYMRRKENGRRCRASEYAFYHENSPLFAQRVAAAL